MSSIIPLMPDASGTVYLLLTDYGPLGRAWVETDENRADAETVVDHLVTAQYDEPIKVVAFNATEGWAKDVSAEIAQAVLKRAETERRDLAEGVREFVERSIEATRS